MNALTYVPTAYDWARQKIKGSSTRTPRAPHPITTIFRLALLKHYDDKSRIHIDENDKITIQSYSEPEGMLPQGLERYKMGADHNEIGDLDRAIKTAIKWLEPLIDSKIREIFGWAQMGLDKLKKAYIDERTSLPYNYSTNTVAAIDGFKFQIQTTLDASVKLLIPPIEEITYNEVQKNPSIKPVIESILIGLKTEQDFEVAKKEGDQSVEKDSERKELISRTIDLVENGLKEQNLISSEIQSKVLLNILKNNRLMKTVFGIGLIGLKNKLKGEKEVKDGNEEKTVDRKVNSKGKARENKEEKEEENKIDPLAVLKKHSATIESALIDYEKDKNKEKNAEEIKKELWSDIEVEIIYQQFKKLDQFNQELSDISRCFRDSIKNFLDGQDKRYQIIKQKNPY